MAETRSFLKVSTWIKFYIIYANVRVYTNSVCCGVLVLPK